MTFTLLVENNVRLVISSKNTRRVLIYYFDLIKYYFNGNLRIMIDEMNKITNYFFYLILMITTLFVYYYWCCYQY
jgi:hypothetical protein